MQRIDSLEGQVGATTVIAARPETVWAILSTEEGLSQWLQAEATFQPSVGEAFRIFFPMFQMTIAGEVLEVVAERNLVLSWGAEDGPQAGSMPAGSTRLTFELAPEDGGTRVAVFQEGLPADLQEAQNQGWRFQMSRLDLVANRSQLAFELPQVMDAYFRAWSVEDDDERRSLLEASCTEDVAFMDEHAAFSSRDFLATHAGNTRKYFPGSRILRSGEPTVCRGDALVSWEAVDGEGAALFSGTNYVRISPGGRIARVTGFWGGRWQPQAPS